SGSAFTVLRYLGDGKLDPAFGTGGVSKGGPDIGGAHALVQLSDGRLILAGERLVGDWREVTIARYRPDGTLDTGFGQGGAIGTDVTPGHDDGTAAEEHSDLNKDGKPDVWILDEDRDGRWDISFWDTDFDGKPDLVGFHPDGELTPRRFEKYKAKN
ncbi:MAG: delta-60 repeat domain-containing protein, partial [Thermoplasmatota archaeon]